MPGFARWEERRRGLGRAITVAYGLLLALLLGFLAPVPTLAATDPPPIEDVIEAARSEGLRVVLAEPANLVEPEVLSTAWPLLDGHVLAATAAEVTERIRHLAARVAEPGWPAAVAQPAKPVQIGLFAVLGIAAGLAVLGRAGFPIQPRFETPAADPRRTGPGRPVRIALALLAIAIAMVPGAILPLVVVGSGATSIGLLGKIADAYLRCAILLTLVAACAERAHERQANEKTRAETRTIYRTVRNSVVFLFLFFSVAYVVSFVYPDPAVATFARLASYATKV